MTVTAVVDPALFSWVDTKEQKPMTDSKDHRVEGNRVEGNKVDRTQVTESKVERDVREDREATDKQAEKVRDLKTKDDKAEAVRVEKLKGDPPSVGRIVLYRDPFDKVSPAIIRQVNDDNTVQVFVFGETGYAIPKAVRQGDSVDTWRWPPSAAEVAALAKAKADAAAARAKADVDYAKAKADADKLVSVHSHEADKAVHHDADRPDARDARVHHAR